VSYAAFAEHLLAAVLRGPVVAGRVYLPQRFRQANHHAALLEGVRPPGEQCVVTTNSRIVAKSRAMSADNLPIRKAPVQRCGLAVAAPGLASSQMSGMSRCG
jgi:hypothetical protein